MPCFYMVQSSFHSAVSHLLLKLDCCTPLPLAHPLYCCIMLTIPCVYHMITIAVEKISIADICNLFNSFVMPLI
jgi:hypothetical protein